MHNNLKRILVTVALLCTPVAITAAPIIKDGFESGSLSYTNNGFRWHGSVKTTVTSDISRTGSKSLKFTYLKSAINKDSFAEQRFDLGKAYPEVWIQYYIYFPDGSEGIGARYKQRRETGPNNNKFLRLWGNIPRTNRKKSIIGGGISMFPSSGYSKIGVEYFSTFNGAIVKSMGQYRIPSRPLVTPSTIGTWIKFKYHAKAASAANNDGVIQVWLNDALVVDERNLSTYPGNGYQNAFTAGYLLGWANTGFDETTNIYIDDFEISVKTPPIQALPRPPTILQNNS